MSVGEARRPPAAIPCRWKHVRGEGRQAIYRATCGQGQCRGHLGDLAWRGLSDEDLRRWLEAADAHARHQWLAEHHQELLHLYDLGTPEDGPHAEVLAETVRGLVLDEAQGRGWFMVPRVLTRPDDDKQPIYYGYADSGYRISFSGKRSHRGRGQRVGRRPLGQSMPGWAVEAAGSERVAAGQPVRPPAHIWCPISSCGALNHLGWPEPLKDLRAR
jgi:hypothetical protein